MVGGVGDGRALALTPSAAARRGFCRARSWQCQPPNAYHSGDTCHVFSLHRAGGIAGRLPDSRGDQRTVTGNSRVPALARRDERQDPADIGDIAPGSGRVGPWPAASIMLRSGQPLPRDLGRHRPTPAAGGSTSAPTRATAAGKTGLDTTKGSVPGSEPLLVTAICAEIKAFVRRADDHLRIDPFSTVRAPVFVGVVTFSSWT